ncbi:hypothetical protein BRYFOR_08101 [Marvinbryantia formatexigens DSM 14469]|uniref:Uncharacterized protein n=1 Tax=Marvinbryantia formatexigens DSM 14469 TaxID=478749 RepID=C6LHJ0_9FIRM|nr:hypothetical protein [Marvinbryantia formatexigens]EET59977.1 hypothetical protein BRYFOR_08101 [Marvinbryantia formatexigens DSM 14469]UWO25868.1 hypothetical protein NQ534_05180 [Marvinbryantia formatexigens DSM 14469]SDF40790.1 hypothetical protein SAMN05660368_00682 [Marvinbryantia formatexigens]
MNSKRNFLSLLRKKALPGGITFLAAGILICFIGFAMAHFDFSNLEFPGTPKWYLTVHIDEGQFELGIRLGEDARITGFSVNH